MKKEKKNWKILNKHAGSEVQQKGGGDFGKGKWHTGSHGR